MNVVTTTFTKATYGTQFIPQNIMQIYMMKKNGGGGRATNPIRSYEVCSEA